MSIRNASFVHVLVLGLWLWQCGQCEKSDWSSSLRFLVKFYDSCQNRDLVSCLKIKAINFFDRMERNNEIVLDDHLSIVRDGPPPQPTTPYFLERMARNMGENETGDQESTLNDLLLRKVSDFFNGHKIVFNLPKIRPDDIKEEVAEGRGKMKKMMSMMMMGLAMKKAAAIPMALGLLFLLAGKALIISKLALVLTLIIALKKLKSSSK